MLAVVITWLRERVILILILAEIWETVYGDQWLAIGISITQASLGEENGQKS